MATAGFDAATIKKDFPILSRQLAGGQELVYLDSAATSQKPYQVLDAERHFYENSNAAVHRGVHQLAEEATDAYEKSRATIAHLISAEPEELVFTRNATEAINLLSYSFVNATLRARSHDQGSDFDARLILKPGDEILVSEMEHHANLVPWQEVCAKTGATLKWFGVTDEGRLDLSNVSELVGSRTKVISITHVSNVTGVINPVSEIAREAARVGALLFIDACQSVPHLEVDVHALGADAIAFSGHKMLGPTGVGCLWARSELLQAMPPFLTGGSMIERVTMKASTYAPPPKKFEAGTPVVAQAVGLAAATDYLRDLGLAEVAEHDRDLTQYALDRISELPQIRIIGPTDTKERIGAISFVFENVHPHDVGQVLDDQGVAVRTGHHCAWPLMRRFDVPATTRASFYVYNDHSDVDALVSALRRVQGIFG